MEVLSSQGGFIHTCISGPAGIFCIDVMIKVISQQMDKSRLHLNMAKQNDDKRIDIKSNSKYTGAMLLRHCILYAGHSSRPCASHGGIQFSVRSLKKTRP